MLITLNNQRTVDIPFCQFDDMTDEQYRNFLNSDYGEVIQDPFFNSQLDLADRRFTYRPDEGDTPTLDE